MKTKQKLVIALATLTAGVLAAGATSTVAWFVANREATFSYNTITVNANAGDLKIKYGGGVGTKNNAEAATGHNFGYSDSVTMSSDNAGKLIDLSSSDGNNFVKAQQLGSAITFVSADDGFLRFYVILQNEATETANIWLKGAGCAITDASGTAANDVRVAVDTLTTNAAPTAKGTTKVTFMDGGTANTFATTANHATYTPAADSTATATLTYTESLSTNSNIILDINGSGAGNYYLGQIAAQSDNTPGVGYVVVTLWYEGTNEAIQNIDIGDSFNLTLDFLVDNVTAPN